MRPARLHAALRHALLLALATCIALPVAAAAATAKPSAAKGKSTAHAVVPFIDDDLERALAEAKQRDLPLFIESWAPW